jgi:hypothetical protein
MFFSGLVGSSVGVQAPVGVVKYDLSGNRQWTFTNGLGYSSGNSAVDNQGNVFTAGTLTNGPFLAKLAPTGQLQWATNVGGPPHTGDEIFQIDVDNAGGVYVAGGTFESFPGSTNAGSRDAFVSKYNSEGVALWTRQFGTPQNEVAYGGVAVDAKGNVYLSGSTFTSTATAFLLKYDSNGNQLWTRQFDGDIRDMTLDALGNVFLTGAIGIVEYNPAGERVWTYKPGNVYYQAMAFDDAGDLFVVGSGTGYQHGIYKLSGIVHAPEPSAIVLAAIAGFGAVLVVCRGALHRRNGQCCEQQPKVMV